MLRTDTHETLTHCSDGKMGSERSFGLVFSCVFALIGGWKVYHGQFDWGWVLLGTSGLFALLAFLIPSALRVPNRIWFRFGQMLHKVISPLVLGFLFFITITPIAILMRLTGKDPLSLRLDPGAKSYWIYRVPPGPEPKSMSQQF